MGADVRVENYSRDFGRPSTVWRLKATNGAIGWLKHHENPLLYQREVLGLEHLVPRLGEQSWWSAPTLIAKDDAIESMLISQVDGEILDSASVPDRDESEMFRLAGRFSRLLHSLDVTPSDGLSIREYLRDRLGYYLNEGKDAVDAEIVDSAEAMIGQACASVKGERVACHMDYSPRNWLLNRSSHGIRFGVIDWERARYDTWLQDVQRMEYDWFHRKPHLREAFFEGYGRELTDIERVQLDAICLVMAIASIPWAIRHNDHQFALKSHQVIELITSYRIVSPTR